MQYGLTPTNLHVHICFISEHAYQKDRQYSTADNQRATIRREGSRIIRFSGKISPLAVTVI